MIRLEDETVSEKFKVSSEVFMLSTNPCRYGGTESGITSLALSADWFDIGTIRLPFMSCISSNVVEM